MKGQDSISTLLAKLHAASPAGFAIALHVRFTAPRYLFQSYAKEWLDTYSREGLVLHDPVVRWGFTHEGTIRWSALDDPAGVMDRAAAHGLRHGAVVAFVRDGSRTMAGFARGDRELTDDEIATLKRILEDLHDLTGTVETFSPDVHMTLKQMSIYLTHG
ncbi:autoinducer binding domain-containing protein [Albidovulum sp.]|uniref:autoinducer binding domain-containing protein n=1 Tax=Albidovulum sp. TaxID=1872424 RepID=UPI0025BC51D0|nr:autoinducer binding domain-containing protein [Defluviimonas sp.]